MMSLFKIATLFTLAIGQCQARELQSPDDLKALEDVVVGLRSFHHDVRLLTASEDLSPTERAALKEQLSHLGNGLDKVERLVALGKEYSANPDLDTKLQFDPTTQTVSLEVKQKEGEKLRKNPRKEMLKKVVPKKKMKKKVFKKKKKKKKKTTTRRKKPSRMSRWF